LVFANGVKVAAVIRYAIDESKTILTLDITGLAIVGTEPKSADATIMEIYPTIFGLFLNLRKSFHQIKFQTRYYESFFIITKLSGDDLTL
jgi:hypothetical protein